MPCVLHIGKGKGRLPRIPSLTPELFEVIKDEFACPWGRKITCAIGRMSTHGMSNNSKTALVLSVVLGAVSALIMLALKRLGALN